MTDWHALWDSSIWGAVILIALLVIMYERIAKPAWRFIRWAGREADDRDQLKQLIEAIGPLNGRNLMQRLTDLEAHGLGREQRIAAIERQQIEVSNKIDVFLIAQMRGGRRFYDPACHDEEEDGTV